MKYKSEQRKKLRKKINKTELFSIETDNEGNNINLIINTRQ